MVQGQDITSSRILYFLSSPRLHFGVPIAFESLYHSMFHSMPSSGLVVDVSSASCREYVVHLCIFDILKKWQNAKAGSQKRYLEQQANLALEYKWSRAKTNRVLPRECSGHSKHPLPEPQEKTTHGHHQMVNTKIRLIIFSAKDGAVLYTQQKKDWDLNFKEFTSWTSYCRIQT